MKKTVRRPMLTIPRAGVKMHMEHLLEAQARADVMIMNAAAVAGEITVPHGRGVSHHALIAGHRPHLLHLGRQRSPSSNLAKLKVGKIQLLVKDVNNI